MTLKCLLKLKNEKIFNKNDKSKLEWSTIICIKTAASVLKANGSCGLFTGETVGWADGGFPLPTPCIKLVTCPGCPSPFTPKLRRTQENILKLSLKFITSIQTSASWTSLQTSIITKNPLLQIHKWIKIKIVYSGCCKCLVVPEKMRSFYDNSEFPTCCTSGKTECLSTATYRVLLKTLAGMYAWLIPCGLGAHHRASVSHDSHSPRQVGQCSSYFRGFSRSIVSLFNLPSHV